MKEITLQNGHTFKVETDIRGKHLRKIDGIRLSLTDPNEYVDRYADIAKIFLLEAKTQEGAHIDVTLDYIDNLSREDYQTFVEELVTNPVNNTLRAPKV